MTRTERLRRIARGIAALVLVAAAVPGVRAQLEITQIPAVLPTPLPANVLLTLDDSGSMRSAFVPDSMCSGGNVDTVDSRRFKSAAFNSLYYDPNVRYAAPKTETGSDIPSFASNSFTAAYLNGFDTSRGTINLSSAYRPTLGYDPSSNSAPTQAPACGGGDVAGASHMYARNPTADYPGDEARAVAAYYYKHNGVGSCPLSDDNCYTRVLVGSDTGPGGTDERQNFATWYSFYRTRNLLTASATSIAMASLPTTARLGWQSLNRCNNFATGCRGWTTSTVDSRLKVFAGSHRTNFYAWLYRLPAEGTTPLRTAAARVATYLRGSSGVSSPWAEVPYDTNAAPNREFSCRPNFHIAMTDGLWNDSDASFCRTSAGATTSCGNADNDSARTTTLPDGKVYDRASAFTRVYRDGNSNSLADIAFNQWATDLRTDLKNDVQPYVVDRRGTDDAKYWNPRNDPANWQHIVTFTVGLGLTGSLNETSPVDLRWPGSAFGNPAYTNLRTGTGDAPWPALTPNDPGRVYDLWHAGINGRGEAFSAERPTEVVEALVASLNRVAATNASAAALASSSTRATDGTLLFQARFFTADWSGELRAFPIGSGASVGDQLWTTSGTGKFASASTRRIVTWSGSAGIAFTRDALSNASLLPRVAVPVRAETDTETAAAEDDVINWVRGDQSKEQSVAKGIYRTRTVLLGDIVNSNPVFVGQQNFGYTGLPEGRFGSDTPYSTFFDGQATRRKMVYVAANDGMLHGFDAATGVEQFAYLPQEVLARLPELAEPAYVHQFVLDGTPRVRDAFVSNGTGGGAWKTILVGTAGVGAKTIFALDVTSPNDFGTSSVLWEINSTRVLSGDDAADPNYAGDLGLTTSQGIPVKLNNGEWGVIFGNGLNSVNQRAVLYIVRLRDGALIRKIDTGIGSTAAPNGLGTPTLHDANGDQVYDTVYAPDNRGNVWKFDISSTSASDWRIAFTAATGFPNGAPLFSARTVDGTGGVAQPIQARVELTKPPIGVNGLLVLFGTGRLLATGDNINTTKQTVYGILDNGSTAVTARSQLQEQTISTSTATVNGVAGVEVRRVTRNTVDWLTKRGWFIDLPTSMERVIGTPLLRGTQMIVATVIPSNDPCERGGGGWLMQMNARTGAEFDTAAFDTNNDGVVNDSDGVLAGLQITVGMAGQAGLLDGTPISQVVLSGTNADSLPQKVGVKTSLDVGRNSWRQAR